MAIEINGVGQNRFSLRELNASGNGRSDVSVGRQVTADGELEIGLGRRSDGDEKSITRFRSRTDEEGNQITQGVRFVKGEDEISKSRFFSRTDEEGNQLTKIAKTVVSEDGEKSRYLVQVKETDEGTFIRAISQTADSDSRSAQRVAIKVDDEGNVLAQLAGRSATKDPETGEIEKTSQSTTIQTTLDQVEEGSQLDKILDLVV